MRKKRKGRVRSSPSLYLLERRRRKHNHHLRHLNPKDQVGLRHTPPPPMSLSHPRLIAIRNENNLGTDTMAVISREISRPRLSDISIRPPLELFSIETRPLSDLTSELSWTETLT